MTQTVLMLERGYAEDGATDASTMAGEMLDLARIAQSRGRSKDPIVRQQIGAAMVADFAVEQIEARVHEYVAATPSADAGVAAYAALASGAAMPERAKAAVRIAGDEGLFWAADHGNAAMVATGLPQ